MNHSMKLNRSVVLLSVLMFLGGCANLSLLRPQATRRYKEVFVVSRDTPRTRDTTPLWKRRWVETSVFSIAPPAPENAVRDVFTLAGEGQAAYVEALAARATDAAGLSSALVSPLQRQPPPVSRRNLGRVKRRVVFSVANRSTSPADRLSSVRLTLQPDSGVRFTGWDKLATAYETVDVGTLTFSQKATAGGEIAAAFPPVTPKVTGSTEAGMEEQLNLRERLVSLTGIMTPTTASLFQQSIAGRDLTGNVIADFDLELPTQPSRAFTEVSYPAAARGSVDCAHPPEVLSQMVEVPVDSGRGVNATLVVDYVLRRVVAGHASMYEGDDVVYLVHGSDTLRNAVIIPPSDLRVQVWELVGPGNLLLQGEEVSIGRGEAIFQFGSYESAVRMRNWLARCEVERFPAYRFFVGEEPITRGTIPDLRILTHLVSGADADSTGSSGGAQPGTRAKNPGR